MVSPTPAAQDATRNRQGPLAGVSVVVVEDQDHPRDLFRDVLELAGARATITSSARAALAAIESEVPDVVVSDIMMPNEDGYWLLEAVLAFRKKAGGRRPRTLAITGDPRRHSRDRALAAGYDVYLSKPLDIDVLCAMVGRLAGRFPA